MPDHVSTDELTARLTLTGLKLEGIHSPGAQITGPLVVGRVLTMEPEPQKNGKTINWCTVDVADANGTGEPQGIVCGAHNFAPGDLVVVVLPGGVLPGGFEISARKTYGHVSSGMICSAAELGLGDDHDGIIVLPADAGKPGEDVRRPARPRRGDHRVRDQPGPGLRPVPAGHRPRGAGLRRRRAVPRPGAAGHPCGQRPGTPGRRRGPGGLSRVRGPHGHRLRPDGADARLHRPAPHRGGHASDLARRRRHQLRDARDGAADPRLRRRQAAGTDRRTRARAGERLTTLDGTARTLSARTWSSPTTRASSASAA